MTKVSVIAFAFVLELGENIQMCPGTQMSGRKVPLIRGKVLGLFCCFCFSRMLKQVSKHERGLCKQPTGAKSEGKHQGFKKKPPVLGSGDAKDGRQSSSGGRGWGE